jgi:hypothetical protein
MHKFLNLCEPLHSEGTDTGSTYSSTSTMYNVLLVGVVHKTLLLTLLELVLVVPCTPALCCVDEHWYLYNVLVARLVLEYCTSWCTVMAVIQHPSLSRALNYLAPYSRACTSTKSK